MNGKTWMDSIRALRLRGGERLTDGARTWDVERDGFGRYTLRGVEKETPSVWDGQLAHTPAPAELRFCSAGSKGGGKRRKQSASA